MYSKLALASLSLLAAARGQQVGTNTAETHPGMSMQTCTASGTCTTKNTKIVLDANWRWLHTTSGYTNCYTGNEWNTTICSDPTTCASKCALDGADYTGTYGISASGNSMKMTFVTKGQYSTNIGARVYLLADDSTYQTFKLKNQEFTFDVDMSNLPCGLNGALYFSQMDADGGMAKNKGNKAGAKYGTGYCDAQCPHDMKFINGEVSLLFPD
jgi:cellulose 1,4-beta-cellobiosidase